MTTTSKGHHSHHGHHRMDSASQFKRDSLRAIERRKLLAKWGFRVLCVIAALSVIALIAVYLIG